MRIVFSLLFFLIIACSGFNAAARVIMPAEKPNIFVTFDTTRGQFTMRLRPDRAPQAVQLFKQLVTSNYYDDLYYHSVVPGYIAQTGDPELLAKPRPNFSPPPLELNDLLPDTGMVGVDPSQPGMQIFILTGEWQHLRGKYTLFAEVISGMHVVHRLRIGDKVNWTYLHPSP